MVNRECPIEVVVDIFPSSNPYRDVPHDGRLAIMRYANVEEPNNEFNLIQEDILTTWMRHGSQAASMLPVASIQRFSQGELAGFPERISYDRQASIARTNLFAAKIGMELAKLIYRNSLNSGSHISVSTWAAVIGEDSSQSFKLRNVNQSNQE